MILEDRQLYNSAYLFKQVLKESERQVELHGIGKKYIHSWLAILAEEFGELSKAINNYTEGRKINYSEIEQEAIEVATVALKIAESIRHFKIQESVS